MAEIGVAREVLDEYGIPARGLTVIQHPVSPFCAAITSLLDAAGAAYTSHLVQIWDRRPAIAVTQGRYYAIPTLVDADRTPPVAVYEHRDDAQDIGRYLDEKLRLGLFPAEQAGLLELVVQHVEGQVEDVGFRLNDAYFLPELPDVVERAMYIRHKERKFGKGCVEQWRAQRDELTARLLDVLAPLDRMLARHPFLLGDRPTYADYALYGVLANLTYTRHNTLPAALTHILRWHAALPAVRLPYAGTGYS